MTDAQLRAALFTLFQDHTDSAGEAFDQLLALFIGLISDPLNRATLLKVIGDALREPVEEGPRRALLTGLRTILIELRDSQSH